jgi:hypothetical protein
MKDPERKGFDPGQFQIETHLTGGDPLAAQAARLEEMIASLSDYKEVFCPEVWRLYDFAVHAVDPAGLVNAHAAKCRVCLDKISELRWACQADAAQPVPCRLLEAVKKAQPARITLGDRCKRFADLFASKAFVPAVSGALAAAAVVGVVVMYPRATELTRPKDLVIAGAEYPRAAQSTPSLGETLVKPSLYPPVTEQVALGLSSVAWDPKITLMSPAIKATEAAKPKVAVVLVFKGFESELSQTKIDSLYEYLRPEKELRQKFSFAPPDKIRKCFPDGTASGEKKQLLAELQTCASDSKVVVVTLSPDRDRTLVAAELIGPGGDTLAAAPAKAASEQEIASAVKSAALSLLESIPSPAGGKR